MSYSGGSEGGSDARRSQCLLSTSSISATFLLTWSMKSPSRTANLPFFRRSAATIQTRPRSTHSLTISYSRSSGSAMLWAYEGVAA